MHRWLDFKGHFFPLVNGGILKLYFSGLGMLRLCVFATTLQLGVSKIFLVINLMDRCRNPEG